MGELERKKQKPFKFSNQSDADPVEEQSKTKKRKKNKRKAEADGMSGLEGLTGDEKMAVELYQVIKKSRNNKDLEEDDEGEEEAEKRAITYKIAKNKGLMPKRSKLQRNPRVKNRMKFEKAKKRRKGAVREVRDQNHKYSGEASGLNVRVKKGVKIK